MYLKKRTARILCAAMAAMMLLSGCGSSGTGTAESAASGESTAASGSTGGGKNFLY